MKLSNIVTSARNWCATQSLLRCSWIHARYPLLSPYCSPFHVLWTSKSEFDSIFDWALSHDPSGPFQWPHLCANFQPWTTPFPTRIAQPYCYMPAVSPSPPQLSSDSSESTSSTPAASRLSSACTSVTSFWPFSPGHLFLFATTSRQLPCLSLPLSYQLRPFWPAPSLS